MKDNETPVGDPADEVLSAQSTGTPVEQPIVCPECAAPASQRSVRPPWALRRRRLLQIAAVLIALGYVVWRNIGAWPVLGAPSVYTSVPFSAEFPAQRLSRSDIEQYAASEIADGRLTAFLNDEMPEDSALGVSFESPSGYWTQSIRYGWPHSLLFYRYDANYEDIYTHSNPSSQPPTTRNGWWGSTYMFKRIDETGRLKTFMFSIPSLATIPALLIAVWALGRAVRWTILAVRLAQWNGTRWRDRIARRVPLFLTAVCAIGLVAMVFVPRREAGWGYPVPFNIAFSETGVTGADIAGFKETPAGESAFARVILDATETTAESEDTCLVYAWRSEIGGTTNYATGGWPLSLIQRSTYGQQGVSEEAQPTTRIKWSLRHVTIESKWNGDRTRTETTNLSLMNVAPIALGLAVAWLCTGFAAWFVGWAIRRRSARRVARGACVACGYDLSGLERGERG